MNNDFRQRVFLPIVMPLGVVVGFIGFAFALSRILLAVPAIASTAIALGIAAYILLIASVVTAKRRITSRALALGVGLGLVAVAVAGILAGFAGSREIVPHGEEEAPAVGEAAGEEPTEAAGGGSTFVAVDIAFEAAPSTLPAGDTEITLQNDGAAEHNVTFDDVNNEEPVVVAAAGSTESATVSLEPGEYRYYCSVPGHESAMNGELTVE